MIEILLFILVGHMIGDYLLQTDYLAANKGKDNYLLLAHSVLYIVGIMVASLFFGIFFSNIELLLMIIIHFIVDYLKARGITGAKLGDKKALILDQAIHYATLVLFIVV